MKITLGKQSRNLFTLLLVSMYSLLAIGQDSIHHLIVGKRTPIRLQSIGTELDPFFFSQNLKREDGSKAEDWDNIVIKRVQAMKLQSLRIMVLPQWYEPLNDDTIPHHINWEKFTFNTIEMQSLYKVLDMAEQEQIRVTLVLWGASPKHFLAEGNFGGWMIAPTDVQEWCENFSALVQYLLKEKKYTCIKEVTPINEPDWSYIVQGKKASVEEYIQLCKTLDMRFKKDGIRHKVNFNLSDNSDGNTGTHEYLNACTDKLSDTADLFNSHTYIFGYETPNSDIFKWECENVRLAAICNKKHFVGEFGGNQCIGASRQKDIDLYERGVLMARIIINLLNAGASGVSYWSLIDQYYENPSYDSMQQLGLWKYVKKAYVSEAYYEQIKTDYEVRPQYHAYSLFTRFIRPGAEIYPIFTLEEWYAGTAIRNKDRKWVYAFANADKDAKSISITNKYNKNKNKYQIYYYIKERLPEADKMIISHSSLLQINAKMKLELPPNSVVFLKEE